MESFNVPEFLAIPTIILEILFPLLIIAGYAQQMAPSCDKGIEVKYVPRNIFDELERFNSIYNPIETIIIHNYKNEQKIKDIIQFAALQTKSIHIVNQLDKTDQAKMANKCDQQTFQKEIIHDFYDDINDY